MLYYSGLCISLINNNSNSLEDIKNIINENRKHISKVSSKRGNDWFNISSSTIKKINIFE